MSTFHQLIYLGNHDITLDPDFYAEHGLYFHNQYPQDPAACSQMFRESLITYLHHEAKEVTLTKDSGPGTVFKIFGSPYSPARGLWAFGYQPEQASSIWSSIPLDTDIVLTHTPPKYHCDESRKSGSEGCEILRQTLWRVRPKLAVCGHVHDGRGAERILWDLTSPNLKYKEDTVGYWTDPDPNGKKQCLLDLTAKGLAPLRNAQIPDWGNPANLYNDDASEMKKARSSNIWTRKRCSASASGVDKSEIDSINATRGQGGAPPSGRSDLDALSGRLGRRETCVINAAIMASSWPYQKDKGRKYNKPFIIDVDLPTQESIDRARTEQ